MTIYSFIFNSYSITLVHFPVSDIYDDKLGLLFFVVIIAG